MSRKETSAGACSTIGVAATQHEPAYVAQNMDLESFRDGAQTVLQIGATGGAPADLVFTAAGLIAPNGVNERSVGVVVNTLSQLRPSRTGLPVAFVVRGILQQASAKAAADFVTGVAHASGQNYIIAGPDGVYDLKASAGKAVAFTPGAPVVYHTNDPLANDDLNPRYAQAVQAGTAKAFEGDNSHFVVRVPAEAAGRHPGCARRDPRDAAIDRSRASDLSPQW